MPRYLRWIAAGTAGLVVQFAFFVAVGAVAVGTGRRELSGFAGALITFASIMVTVVTALGINDWLASRYPMERTGPRRQ